VDAEGTLTAAGDGAPTNVQTVRDNIPVGRLTHLHTVAITR
jgi:hypothetical protein